MDKETIELLMTEKPITKKIIK